jgi:hypothetical protein
MRFENRIQRLESSIGADSASGKGTITKEFFEECVQRVMKAAWLSQHIRKRKYSKQQARIEAKHLCESTIGFQRFAQDVML